MTEIAILSGKGGTGKSSVCAAFTSLESNLVVADCDVDAANLHIILQPKNYREEIYVSGQKAILDAQKCNNCGKCFEYCRFDAIEIVNKQHKVIETACDGCQLCERVCPEQAIKMEKHDKSRWYVGNVSNGKMIHARLAPGEDNSGKLVNIVRDEARKIAAEINSDLILLDGPPGIGCPVISTLTGINHAVLVTEPTQSGIHDLERIITLIHQFKIPGSVIINKCDINQSLSNSIEKWCKSNNIPVIGKLPFDKVVVEAMVNCQNVIDWAPNSSISNEIKSIWKNLSKERIKLKA